MKNKELKKLANEIMKLEQVIERNEDADVVEHAKNRIMKISGSLNPEDMFRIDEIIQEQLQKKVTFALSKLTNALAAELVQLNVQQKQL